MASMTQPALTELEQRIIAFAVARRPLHETRTEFGWRPAAYVMRLHRLLDDPRAEKADPMNVRRLRKVRDEKTANRANRMLA
jgi:two-component sensor histidine kinase